jgi:hypothetical protein
MRVGLSMWDPPSCEGLLYSCCIDVVNLIFSVKITCYLNSMCFLYAFLIVLIKKNTCDFQMFEGHMSFLYVGCKKFSTNQFV